MKKLFTVVAFILLICAIYLSGCVFSKSQTISEIANFKSSVITKIIFYDGRGGLNKPLTIDNKQKIDEFIGYLNKSIVKKENTSEQGTGWIHSAVFYSNDKKVIEITFGNPIVIDKSKYYKAIKNDLSTKEIDNYLKSVNSSWKTP
jgi:hypothetical protein